MLSVQNPFNLSTIQEIPMQNSEYLASCINTAHKLFEDQKNWLAPHVRIKILSNAKELMKIRKEELIATATQEGGKPLLDTKVEIERAINGVQLAIEGISQLKGEQIPMGLTPSSDNRISYTTVEPIGVVAAISAFNHPVNLIVHQVVTAIAAGCPVIVKPALTTPLSCLLINEILNQSGLPQGWCQVLICDDQVAEQLATDSRINFLSFIGSAKVGWYLKSKLAPGTRCALEHGGVAPVVVEEDANIQELIPALIKGGFYHAGQVCVSVQKVYISKSIVNEVAGNLVEMTNSIVVGNPLEENTDVGPLILPEEVNRVEQWVQEAIDEGAILIYGGKRISDTCYAPTILLNPSESSKVSTQEIFGPVICLYTTESSMEAVQKVNALNVHFQAAVFTKNIDKALSLVKQINASAVMVNDHTTFRVDWMPFGGRDHSGIGVGGILPTMKEMSREKLTVIKHS